MNCLSVSLITVMIGGKAHWTVNKTNLPAAFICQILNCLISSCLIIGYHTADIFLLFSYNLYYRNAAYLYIPKQSSALACTGDNYSIYKSVSQSVQTFSFCFRVILRITYENGVPQIPCLFLNPLQNLCKNCHGKTGYYYSNKR